jgi:hypothetical protein
MRPAASGWGRSIHPRHIHASFRPGGEELLRRHGRTQGAHHLHPNESRNIAPYRWWWTTMAVLKSIRRQRDHLACGAAPRCGTSGKRPHSPSRPRRDVSCSRPLPTAPPSRRIPFLGQTGGGPVLSWLVPLSGGVVRVVAWVWEVPPPVSAGGPPGGVFRFGPGRSWGRGRRAAAGHRSSRHPAPLR